LRDSTIESHETFSAESELGFGGAPMATDRPLTVAERLNFESVLVAARKPLGKYADSFSPEQVQHLICEMIVHFRSLTDEKREARLSRTAQILGCMWGQSVCDELGWEWASVTLAPEQEVYAVVTPSRSHMAFPLALVGALLVDLEKEQTTSLLLYNSLKDGSLPPAGPREYFVVGYRPSSNEAIVVLEASVAHRDPHEIVASNVWFVNALRKEHLTFEEIPFDALRSYYVDYYLAQMINGGFSWFVYHSRWSPLVVEFIGEGMRAMGARRHLEIFERGAKLVDAFDPDRLQAFFASDYFGANLARVKLNTLDKEFFAAKKAENLVALNAAWLLKLPNLRPLATVEEMQHEARRRGQALPDRERRVAEALADEMVSEKLIRAVCSRAGQELKCVTAADPARVHEGTRTVAFHFVTDKGHHHMVLAGGKAIMFRGRSTTDRVCEVDYSVE
jgi:hypothetical protein